MTTQAKKIAAIFEEQMVFLTKTGKYYNYGWVNGRLKCHKMDRVATKDFLVFYLQQVVAIEAQMVAWQPVAKTLVQANNNNDFMTRNNNQREIMV